MVCVGSVSPDRRIVHNVRGRGLNPGHTLTVCSLIAPVPFSHQASGVSHAGGLVATREFNTRCCGTVHVVVYPGWCPYPSHPSDELLSFLVRQCVGRGLLRIIDVPDIHHAAPAC